MPTPPSGSTPGYALPYPIPADNVDVPRDIQALATKLDGTTLPGINSQFLTVTNDINDLKTPPTWSARQNADQAVSQGNWTILHIDTEDWDSNNNHTPYVSGVTECGYSPGKAGTYMVTVQATFANVINLVPSVAIWKNGVTWRSKQGYREDATGSLPLITVSVQALVQVIPGTDTLFPVVYCANAGATVKGSVSNPAPTWWQGIRVSK